VQSSGVGEKREETKREAADTEEQEACNEEESREWSEKLAGASGEKEANEWATVWSRL